MGARPRAFPAAWRAGGRYFGVAGAIAIYGYRIRHSHIWLCVPAGRRPSDESDGMISD